MAQSPLQKTRDLYGSKEKLAAAALAILDCPEGEDKDAFEHRVNTMSNRKLLRLVEAAETLSSKFGSKDKLIDAIVKARFSGGNADYSAKISGYSVPRLLDLARQAKL